jgi:3-oxoadipate enol-lactonase
MPAQGAAPFAVGERPTIRGEVAGEGLPIVLCHGITATRRYVLHGSRSLERSGHMVISYDARGHGESDPAAASTGGYGYPELVADLEAVLAATVGERRFLLAGHSMGAHTAVAYALRHPERLTGLAIIGPVYAGSIGSESLAYWDGLADALQKGGVNGFVAYIGRRQGIKPAWRETVMRFTRERMVLHRNLDAQVQALRQVPRSAPFESMEELEGIDLPVLVVASHDEADPGHPYAVAAAYAERLPRAQLAVEGRGESPLAWRGGALSRRLAAFATTANSP